MNARSLISHFRSQGYGLFARPYELNIVGIRSESPGPNRFDDRIVVFFKSDKGKWIFRSYPATTDPGTYWLQNPMEPQGTAILKEGQYPGAYSIAKHQGKYYALCQRLGKVTVIRDYDRNAVLDFQNGRENSGFFGINIHRASSHGTTHYVDKYSAGCQVFANASQFHEFMRLCEIHRSRYGNRFTYTLIDLRAWKRSRRRKQLAIGAGSALTTLLGLKLFKSL